MSNKCSRREFLGRVGLSGIAAGFGVSNLFADNNPSKIDLDSGKVITNDKSKSAVLRSGRIFQPERELPIKCDTDVLVVGGGPAGVAAAIAARKLGVNVAIVERYGCFGGLFTGGLVLLLIGTFSKIDGKPVQIARGINGEMINRLTALGDCGVTEWKEGRDPNADPEAAKYILSEMIRESGAKVFLHSWGVDAIMDGDKVRGAVFESKSGRQAILAKVVVDASGDGDTFAAAGAEYTKYARHIGLVHRIGNVPGDKKFNTPIKGVKWLNMGGDEGDGLDVEVLTRMEMDYRKKIWDSVEKLKKTPGNENVFLLEVAPQLGVRTTRLLKGVTHMAYDTVIKPDVFKDVIGIASAGGKNLVYIPYGALLPKSVDNVIAAGRCISMDLKVAERCRLIPACFTTGMAAGTAAAIAVKDGCVPRNVNIEKLQKTLKENGAYLG
ncbi:MAG: FAD-dependent oxidoreductase [Kiritimatiellae bacterium]|nr:FAD-dependent oxidoreductase [Kiritimatiellia bacterium]